VFIDRCIGFWKGYVGGVPMAMVWSDVVRHWVGLGGVGFGCPWFGLGVIGPVWFYGFGCVLG